MSARFHIHRPSVSPDRITAQFSYSCSTFGAFTETVSFPQALPEGVEGLLEIAAVSLSPSYYKLAAAPRVVVDFPLTEAAGEVLRALHTEGLGEFFARNDLPYPPRTAFEYDTRPAAPTAFATDPDRAVVAFGGGKDSHAALGLLDGAGVESALYSVILSERVGARLAAMTRDPLHLIHRRIDPRLIALGRAGEGYNGHIPITAINSILLIMQAATTGAGRVVFANERGASVPTRDYLGHPVNHQYSKSMAYETLFRAAIAGCGVAYFSILRPFSELWIADYVAREAVGAHDVMASCNRNFVFAGPRALADGVRWCGRCSKCVYTATILAPHLDRAAFLKIFETPVLDLSDNIAVARDLCGIGEAKPWECVGDVGDTFAAMQVLAHSPVWGDAAVPAALREALDRLADIGASREHLAREIASRSDHHWPDGFNPTVAPSSS